MHNAYNIIVYTSTKVLFAVSCLSVIACDKSSPCRNVKLDMKACTSAGCRSNQCSRRAFSQTTYSERTCYVYLLCSYLWSFRNDSRKLSGMGLLHYIQSRCGIGSTECKLHLSYMFTGGLKTNVRTICVYRTIYSHKGIYLCVYVFACLLIFYFVLYKVLYLFLFGMGY